MLFTKNNTIEYLFIKIVCFIILFYLLHFLSGIVFDNYIPWRQAQNPRTRILWDNNYDGSKFVILGDSAFSSLYVDKPEQTIWSRLSYLSNEKVFPAVLNGAKIDDFIQISKIVAKSWPAGSVVFVNLVPARFIIRSAVNLGGGNYEYALSRILRSKEKPSYTLNDIRSRLIACTSELYFYRYRTFIGAYLLSELKRLLLTKETVHHNRIWNRDGDFARNNYNGLLDQTVITDKHLPFDALDDMYKIFREKNIKVVFVLTPLNSKLLDEYSHNDKSKQLKSVLYNVHSKLLDYVKLKNYYYIDLQDNVNPDGFSDSMHTNACGDEIIANSLNKWLQSGMRLSTPYKY